MYGKENEFDQRFEELTWKLVTPTLSKVHHVQTHETYKRDPSSFLQPKRLNYYEDKIDTQPSEEMSRSTLSKINRDLEQKTAFYTNHKKLNSRWTEPDDEWEEFYSRNRGRQDSWSSLQVPFIDRESLSRPRVSSFQSKLPQNINNRSHFDQERISPENVANKSQFDPNIDPNWTNKEALKNAARGTVEDMGEAKEAVKQLGHVTKEAAKNEAKETTKEVVGEENYALLSSVKGAVKQIKENVVDSVKAIPYIVNNRFTEVTDSIVNLAEQGEAALENAVYGENEDTIPIREKRVSPLLNSHISRVSENYSPELNSFTGTNMILNPRNEKSFTNSSFIADPYFTEVSPITNNRKLYRNPGMFPLTFIWICTLLGVGLFLVLFQMIK